MSLPRVLIADDHPRLAECLARLLSPHFEVVGVVGDGSLVVEAASRLQPDVLLLDLSMPHVNGLDVLRQLEIARSSFKVVVVTMFGDTAIGAEALNRGASGFVLKAHMSHELLPALDVVLHGGTYFPKDLQAEAPRQTGGRADSASVELETQQRDVLRLIVRGRRINEIASTLALDAATVTAIKDGIMQLCRVESTAELVRYSITHCLLENVAEASPTP